MPLLSRFILAMTFLGLIGCHPLMHPPPIEAPHTMRSGTQIVTRPPRLHSVSWWKKMHDPVLNHLIALALANSNQLRSAQANILQAQAKLQEARYAWLPTLKASGNGFIGGGWDSHVSPKGSLSASKVLSREGSIQFHGYFTGFVPKYSLNFMNNVYQDKYAKASLAREEATYQSTRLSIISQITGSYFMLLGQREQLQDQRHYLADLKKIRQLETTRYQLGATDVATITELDRQIAAYAPNLDALENSIAQMENTIQILIDHNPGPLTQYGDLNRLPVAGLIPANLPSEVLKHRPDILSAEQNLKMTEANMGVAYANFFPSISMTDLVGASSVALMNLLNIGTGLWVLQGAANIPLLDGVSYAKIKEAKGGYLAAYYNYAQTLRSAFADVDNSLTNQQKMYAIYQRQVQALHSAKHSYALALARYQAGAKDYRDVANAKLVVDTAKLNTTLAKMQQLDSIVEVYQALAVSPPKGCTKICPSPHRREL